MKLGSTGLFRNISAPRFAAAMFLLVSAGMAGIGLALPPDKEFAETVRPFVTDLAQIATVLEGDHRADIVLERVGFDHEKLGIAAESWKTFPVIRKLETAYLSAHEHSEENAAAFLVEVRRSAGELYPLLVVDQPTSKDAVTFKDLPKEKAWSNDAVSTKRITPEAARAIEQIAVTCDAGGLYTYLTKAFGLSPGKAFEVMRQGGTVANGLASGLASVAPERQDAAMTKAVAMTEYRYPLARELTALDRWRYAEPRTDGPKDIEPPPSGPTNPNRPGPEQGFGPGSRKTPINPKTPSGDGALTNGLPMTTVDPPSSRPPSSARSAREYRNFVKQNYGGGGSFRPNSLGSVKFQSVIRFRGGFGGVVLGNDVNDATGRNLRKISWSPSPDGGEIGPLTFEFEGGKVAHLPSVRREDAYAAHAIIFAGVTEKDDAEEIHIEPAAEGEAIGLVGLENAVPYFECGDDDLFNIGNRWNFVIHPAIAKLSLGRAAVLCDVLPLARGRSVLVEQVQRESDRDTARELARLLNKAVTTYKIFDMPVTVSISGEMLNVASCGPDAAGASEDTCRNAFLTFQGFADEDDPIADVPAAFFKIAPALVRASSAYARLNDFARVLALYRWARTAKAESIPPTAPREIAATGSVIATADFVLFAPRFYKLEDAYQSKREEVNVTLSRVVASSGTEIQALDKKLAELQKKLDEQSRLYRESEMLEEQAETLAKEAITLLTPVQRQEYERLKASLASVKSVDEMLKTIQKQTTALESASPKLAEANKAIARLDEKIELSDVDSVDMDELLESAVNDLSAAVQKSKSADDLGPLVAAESEIREAQAAEKAADKLLDSAIDAVDAASDDLSEDIRRKLEQLDEKINDADSDDELKKARDARKEFVALQAPQLAAAEEALTKVRLRAWRAELEASERFDDARDKRDEALSKLVPTFAYWLKLRKAAAWLSDPNEFSEPY